MFRVIGIITSLHLLVACNSNSIEAEETPQDPVEDLWLEVSNSKDHWDYVRFLNLHPESEHFDSALVRFLHYEGKTWEKNGPPVWDCLSNCAVVFSHNSDTILFEHEITSLDSLRKRAFAFISDTGGIGATSDIVKINDKGGHIRTISKGVFYLLPSDSLKNLQRVTMALTFAIRDYKKMLAESWHGKADFNEMQNLDSIFAFRILFGLDFPEPLPPPADE